MANDITTNPRLWVLDTTGAIKAAGNRVFVTSVHFEPAAINNILELSEYAPDGSTAQRLIRLRGGTAAADPVDATFDPPMEFNGVYLSTLTAGSVWVGIKSVDTKITA